MDLVIVCTYQCCISIIFFCFFIGLDLNFVFSFTTLNSKQYYSKFKDHWENYPLKITQIIIINAYHDNDLK